MFVDFFKIIDYIKSKINQIYSLKTNINSKCVVHMSPYKLIAIVTTIFGEFNVLSPNKD
jgi:hypothetical protein